VEYIHKPKIKIKVEQKENALKAEEQE